jgi:DNA adenine methylase
MQSQNHPKLEVELQRARPFLKWAGGKGQLLHELKTRFPVKFEQYHEPFLGGGALFFYLMPTKAYLSDINPDLVNTYQIVKNKLHELIEDLHHHIHEKSYFYKIRGIDRTTHFKKWTDVQKASRFIYLNKTCFNGLHRVNSRGQFNVPFGDYKNPTIADEINLGRCSTALQKAAICCKDYHAVLDQAQKSDFVYFDPPYVPVSTTSNFTGYSKNGFRTEDQEALRDLCIALDKKGVYWMLSNSSTPLILDLYKDFRLSSIEASRVINSKGTLRGRISEVIVTNYDYQE